MQARTTESVLHRLAKLLIGNQPELMHQAQASPVHGAQQTAPPEATQLPELAALDPRLERLFRQAQVEDESVRIWEVRLDELEAGREILALDGAKEVELLIHCLEHLTPFAARYHEKVWRSRRRDNELALFRLVVDELLSRSLELNEEQLVRVTTVLGYFGLRGWMANPPEMVRLFESYARRCSLSEPVRYGLKQAREIIYWGTAAAERRRLMERFSAILDGTDHR